MTNEAYNVTSAVGCRALLPPIALRNFELRDFGVLVLTDAMHIRPIISINL